MFIDVSALANALALSPMVIRGGFSHKSHKGTNVMCCAVVLLVFVVVCRNRKTTPPAVVGRREAKSGDAKKLLLANWGWDSAANCFVRVPKSLVITVRHKRATDEIDAVGVVCDRAAADTSGRCSDGQTAYVV